MLENGYIKEHRSLLAWGWFKDPYTAHLWEYIRLAANWDDRVFKGKTICRGQLVTSYPSMAEATGMSVQNVRTAIKHLKQTGEITMKSYRDYSIITVLNYDKYQSDQQPDNSAANSLTNRQPTGNQQAANRPLTTNEESKKARKQESKKVIAPDLEERFSKSVANAVSDWLAYKTERREGYKPVGLKSLLTEIEHQVQQHGDQAVCDVIRLSMANNWRGIVWDRIQQKQEKQNVFGNQLNDFDREWIERVRGHKS